MAIPVKAGLEKEDGGGCKLFVSGMMILMKLWSTSSLRLLELIHFCNSEQKENLLHLSQSMLMAGSWLSIKRVSWNLKTEFKTNYKKTGLGKGDSSYTRQRWWVFVSVCIHNPIFATFGMQGCKPVSSPLAMNFSKECLWAGDSIDEDEKILYQSITESLMDLMV